MSTTVKFNLVMSNWEQNPIKPSQSLDAKIACATSERKFTGGMDGFAHVSYIISKVMDATDEIWTFTGQQVFTGTFNGKKGTFTANEWGTWDGKAASGNWAILPETAQGELKGLKGGGTYGGQGCGDGNDGAQGELKVDMP